MAESGISSADELFQQAMQQHMAGRLAEAQNMYAAVLARQPDHADALHLLGVLMSQAGKPDQGAELIARAINIKPGIPLYHNNLGTVLKNSGKLKDAVKAYRQSIQLDPDNAVSHCNLGNVLREIGDFEAAIQSCRRALQLKPAYADAYNNLGNALIDCGRNEEALEAFGHALAINPQEAISQNNLGNALTKAALFDEAAEVFGRAVQLNPRLAPAHMGLGFALASQGLIEAGIASCQRSIDLDPTAAGNFSYLAYLANFHPQDDPRQLADVACNWSRRFADPLADQIRPHRNDPTPARKLKIGYVSPDFRDNVMGWLIAPIVENHDLDAFEIHCFSNVTQVDSKTHDFHSNAQHWHEVSRLSDAELADLITQEQIDILVDLAVHTTGNRLLVFARKPAPVQVSYLAYCGYTGLHTIDYIFCDPHFEPAFQNDARCAQERFLLSTGYWCYRPNKHAPAVDTLPAISNGFITFGCLNQPFKINSAVLDLWGQVLQAVPRSHLLLMAPPGVARARVIEHLSKFGIESSRLEFFSRQSVLAYLSNYNRIDIALDPFPFAGGNTTFDALWMGVPVVSLVGKTAVARAGLGILSNAGLTSLIAQTKEDYIRRATDLATDLPHLAHLRNTLRQQLKSSPMMDEKRYTAGLESAYRSMWQTWVDKQI